MSLLRRSSHGPSLALGALGLVTFSASTALAADPPAPPPNAAVKAEYVDKPGATKREQGVRPGLLLGATLNFADNRQVVGQPQGTSFAAGIVVEGSLDVEEGDHEWRNALFVTAGASRTPAVDVWVKTRDQLLFQTTYLYHIVDWFGPFARFELDSQMFPGADPRPAPTTYAIAENDGTTTTITGTRLHLNDPFQPLQLKQSVGAFVQPINIDKVRVEARGGAGAREVFAEGALAINDDAATPTVVEVKELSTFQQVGAEALIEVEGTFRAQRISYTAAAGVLIPLLSTDLPESDTRGPVDLMNVDIQAGLSFKLLEWASLDYRFRLLRQPQLVEEWQVANNLFLTIAYAAGTKAPKAPPPPPECVPALVTPASIPAPGSPPPVIPASATPAPGAPAPAAPPVTPAPTPAPDAPPPAPAPTPAPR